MILPCDHDDAVGLVCAACANDALRELRTLKETPFEEKECDGCRELRAEVARLTEGLEDGLDRIGLVRRYARVWKSNGGPLMQYLAGRLMKVLDADAPQLAVLKSTKLLAAQEGELEGDPISSADVDPGDKFVKRRRATLGEQA